MSIKQWFTIAAVSVLLVTSFSTASAQQRTIVDESIYDVLVDRFFNGDGTNDADVNTQDPTQYAGGDFAGLLAKKDFIAQMGFSLLSIGSIFDADAYTGQYIKSYSTIEEHFGDEATLQQLIEQYNKLNMGIVVDFPVGQVAATHEWLATHAEWAASQQGEIVTWDLTNDALQQQMITALANFIASYDVQGIRFTHIEQVDTAFLNELIATVKNHNEGIYVLTNAPSEADVDLRYDASTESIYREALKTVDQSTAELFTASEQADKPVQLLFDDVATDRFIYDATLEEMFPPTRMKMALATLLLSPGVPVVQYGSEIVMNGQAGPEAHQLYHFRTETEIIDYVKNIQQLRNESATLRNGEWKVLENDNGFITLKRYSEDETWFVVINNTSKTKTAVIPINEIGTEKELRGMFENEVVRENKQAAFSIVLDRETVELYQVVDKKGFNISYIIALAFVFIGYTLFILAMMKRSKRRARQEENKL